MPKWIVETRATVRRTYYVEADNEKDAIAKSVSASPEIDEDENEETMCAYLDKVTV